VRIFEDHRFDLYVMTVSGVHADHGLSEWNPEDAAVKRAALAAASRCLVVADASKVGSTAFARICAVDAVEAIITDGSVDPAQCARLEEAGTSVVVAGATEEEVRK
jgi:DeoR/GlpR family transcriptional regulator of sugar metabolism